MQCPNITCNCSSVLFQNKKKGTQSEVKQKSTETPKEGNNDDKAATDTSKKSKKQMKNKNKKKQKQKRVEKKEIEGRQNVQDKHNKKNKKDKKTPQKGVIVKLDKKRGQMLRGDVEIIDVSEMEAKPTNQQSQSQPQKRKASTGKLVTKQITCNVNYPIQDYS